MLLGTRVQFPPPPFDSLLPLMAGQHLLISVRTYTSEWLLIPARTGALPSAFAMCELPPARSFNGLTSLAPGLALVPALGGDLDSVADLRGLIRATGPWPWASPCSQSSFVPWDQDVSVHQSMGRCLFGKRLVQMAMIEPRHPNVEREFAASRSSNSGRRQEKVQQPSCRPDLTR